MCPSRMAVQMSAGRSPRVAWNRTQSPSGTTICDTIEMYSGDRVSPVPWSPPVYVSATATTNPEPLRQPSSCTPRPTPTGSVMPNSPSSECGIDPVVVGLGVQLLGFLSVSGLFVTVALTYTGGLQGTGDTRSPLYISIVSQIVVPLGLCALFQATRGLRPADIWTAILLGHITRCALSVLRFRQGKWRGIKVAVEPA